MTIFFFQSSIVLVLLAMSIFMRKKKNNHLKELNKKETYINYFKAIEQEFKEKIEQKEKHG